jgi:hemerythrin
MPIFEWDDSYSVGNREIDGHHQHLFELLNRMYDDFTGGVSPRELQPILDELIDYATYHFSAEEARMTSAAYPEFEVHKKEHDRFIKRVVEMQLDLPNRESRLYLEALTFLRNWLAEHILKPDMRYRRYLADGAGGVALKLD